MNARVAAAVLVLGTLTSCDNTGDCVRVTLTVDPVTLSVPAKHEVAPFTYTARTMTGRGPKAGLRVAFRLKAPDSTSGEFQGDGKTNDQGIVRMGRTYMRLSDRQRFLRANRIAAEYDGLFLVDGVSYCTARSEAPFTFVET